jgi:hypothetical protein
MGGEIMQQEHPQLSQRDTDFYVSALPGMLQRVKRGKATIFFHL